MCVLVCSAGDLYTARSAAALVAENGRSENRTCATGCADYYIGHLRHRHNLRHRFLGVCGIEHSMWNHRRWMPGRRPVGVWLEAGMWFIGS